MKILVLNCGSSSLKYQLMDMTDESVVAKGNYERIGQNNSFLTHKVNGEKYVIEQAVPTHDEAIKIVTSCNKVLKVDTEKTEPVNIHCFRSVNITSNTEYIYALTHPNVNEVNSSTCIFYQCGHLSIKEDLILEIVCNVLESAFFDKIRTKEQIGYVTMLLKRTYRGNSGLIALVQSSHKSP